MLSIHCQREVLPILQGLPCHLAHKSKIKHIYSKTIKYFQFDHLYFIANSFIKCAKLAKRNCRIASQTDEDFESITEEHSNSLEEEADKMWTNIFEKEIRKMSLDDPMVAVAKNSNVNITSTSVTRQETNTVNAKDEERGEGGKEEEEDEEEEVKMETENGTDDVSENEKNSLSTARYVKQTEKKSHPKKRNTIYLQRLSQRVKKTSGYFWSGHMFYYTNSNPEVYRQYKKSI